MNERRRASMPDRVIAWLAPKLAPGSLTTLFVIGLTTICPDRTWAADVDLVLGQKGFLAGLNPEITDLALSATHAPSSVVAGQPVTFQLTVTNQGPSLTPVPVAIYVQIGAIPARNELIGISMNRGELETNSLSLGYYTWYVPELKSGQSAVLDIGIRVRAVPGAGIRAALNLTTLDSNWENNETFDLVELDSAPGVFEFSVPQQSVAASARAVFLLVNREGGSAGTVSVSFATVDLTARAGHDYAATNGTVTLTNGETQKTISIGLLPGEESKCDRRFQVGLFGPTDGASVSYLSNNVVTVIEDAADILPKGFVECVTVPTDNPLLALGESTFSTFQLSGDGRYVLFDGTRNGYVPNDVNGVLDLFLRDLTERRTYMLNANHAGTSSSNGRWEAAALSEDGRHVVFQSAATDLTTNVVNGSADIFVRDLAAQTTRLVSVSTSGSGANGDSIQPLISSNGMLVVFLSNASNLVPNCQCEGYNLFARNLASGTTRLITKTMTGGGVVDDLPRPSAISDDGRWVLFASTAGNLVPGDSNATLDVFVRDLQTETTHLVSANLSGQAGNAETMPYSLSGDGRYALFFSRASDLVAGDDNEDVDIFRRDLVAGTTEMVTVSPSGTPTAGGYCSGDIAMTPDGRFVAFSSCSADLVTNVVILGPNLYLRDMDSDQTILVGRACDGTEGVPAYGAKLSHDGRYVAFTGTTRNITPADQSSTHAYRWDRMTGTTHLMSANYNFTRGAAGESVTLDISGDGRTVLFLSTAGDMAAAADQNGALDLYVWREVPPGVTAEVRVTAKTQHASSFLHVTLMVTNFGPDTADNVVLTDSLSGGAKFVAATSTRGSCTLVGGQATCSLGSLARREGAVITLVATPTANGPVTHAAVVSNAAHDPSLLNNDISGAGALTLPDSAKLSIARFGREKYVGWLNTPADFELETSSLELPVLWMPIPSGIQDNGVTRSFMTTDESVTQQFFRLHQQ